MKTTVSVEGSTVSAGRGAALGEQARQHNYKYGMTKIEKSGPQKQRRLQKPSYLCGKLEENPCTASGSLYHESQIYILLLVPPVNGKQKGTVAGK